MQSIPSLPMEKRIVRSDTELAAVSAISYDADCRVAKLPLEDPDWAQFRGAVSEPEFQEFVWTLAPSLYAS